MGDALDPGVRRVRFHLANLKYQFSLPSDGVLSVIGSWDDWSAPVSAHRIPRCRDVAQIRVAHTSR
jgi:hypothetical protein